MSERVSSMYLRCLQEGNHLGKVNRDPSESGLGKREPVTASEYRALNSDHDLKNPPKLQALPTLVPTTMFIDDFKALLNQPLEVVHPDALEISAD